MLAEQRGEERAGGRLLVGERVGESQRKAAEHPDDKQRIDAWVREDDIGPTRPSPPTRSPPPD